MNLPALCFGICSAAVVLSRMIWDSMVSARSHTRQSMLLRTCPDRMFASGRCVASMRWMPKARPWRAMIESRFSIRPILSFCSFVKPVLSSTSATSSQAKIWRCKGTALCLFNRLCLRMPYQSLHPIQFKFASFSLTIIQNCI